MPTWSWILMWVIVIAAVALFAFRELRAGRRGPSEVDRHRHAAIREAGANLDGRGPNGASQGWLG